ncbi:helix-turn-helix domain-containing protein [Actinomadura parmotrematis]|uniref:Helix-turn-helix domain-containing protein n=1 Tax=Actinomadura parmotrematis TaxID=2864039 RepID=A0ABS7FRQ5_9ACTN|nr:helix-turn-helix transcriptional regulator [Actinomadura parmotrematis]MBW8482996.1 helix-turn-helix domain-containing protein [Actinomadura parmotrematis]
MALGPVVQQALLTDELVTLRRELGKTQEEVASALDWSTSKLIRIEGANVKISVSDLRSLLRHYGLEDGARVERLVEYARGARTRGWWALYRNDLEPDFHTYLGYEAGASYIRSFQPLRVPGLLQTEEYARAMTIEFVPESHALDVVVDVRMQRQVEVLDKSEPPDQHYLLDEAVIRRWVGAQRDDSIMPRQLRHLLDTAERPGITIDVIPFRSGAHFGLRGEFTVLSFDSALSDILYLEDARSLDLTIGARDSRVADYRDAFDNIRRLALPQEESLALIERIAAEMEAGSAPGRD